jgi:alpha-D-ribose 1-methylphosphonate 5-triphosphate synthase subunit PhnL
VDLASASEARITLLRRREIGFVTQFLHCLPRLTTLDVVARPLLKQGVPRIKAHARAAEVLGLLGLPEQLWDVAPATFSGGERQRVNIARSFAQLPRLILLDEPTASLDAVSRDQVIGLIEATRQRGVAIVAIFHDTGIADRLADIRVEVTNALATPA